MFKIRNFIGLQKTWYGKQPSFNLNTYAAINENSDDFYGLFWNNLRIAVQMHNQFITVVNNIDTPKPSNYSGTSKIDDTKNARFDAFNIKSRLKMIKADISNLWCSLYKKRSALFVNDNNMLVENSVKSCLLHTVANNIDTPQKDVTKNARFDAIIIKPRLRMIKADISNLWGSLYKNRSPLFVNDNNKFVEISSKFCLLHTLFPYLPHFETSYFLG